MTTVVVSGDDLPVSACWGYRPSLIKGATADNCFLTVNATREDEALGTVTGAWMGGMRGIVMMQTSGFALIADKRSPTYFLETPNLAGLSLPISSVRARASGLERLIVPANGFPKILASAINYIVSDFP
jgi:hypothetical protein